MRRWWSRLTRLALTQARGLTLVLGLSLAGVGFQLAQPWPVKLAIDHLRGDPLPDWLARFAERLPGAAAPILLLAGLAAASVLIFLGRRLNELAKSVATATVGTRLSMRCAADLFADLQRRSQAFHARHSTGDLIRRVNNDAGCVRYLVFAVYLPLITALVTLISILLVLWPIDRTLSVVALAMAAPMLIVVRLAAKPMTERAYEQSTTEGRLTANAERMLAAVPVVQAFAQEERERKKFADQADSSIRASMRTLASQLWFKGGVETVTAIGAAIVMIIGGFKAARGHMTVGDLYLCLVYLASLYGPVESLAYLASGWATAKARARRVFELMDASESVRDPDAPVALPRRPLGDAPAVRLRDVRFGYDPSRPVLRDISLDVPAGRTIALVGPSGVGKSTLVSLIPRFIDPWEGAVYVNGVDVRRVRLEELRSRIAYLGQEPMLLPMTVAGNIAYGRPDASREQIVEAARLANAHEFIRKLPDGYDTPIGERSSTLSGGQAQRIAIARAAVLDAPILILDEPTSALDAETEAAVMQALRTLCEQRTAIIIAHRLSTVRRADRIYVMKEGCFVEAGTHEELMAAAGDYHRIVNLQHGLIRDSTDT